MILGGFSSRPPLSPHNLGTFCLQHSGFPPFFHSWWRPVGDMNDPQALLLIPRMGAAAQAPPRCRRGIKPGPQDTTAYLLALSMRGGSGGPHQVWPRHGTVEATVVAPGCQDMLLGVGECRILFGIGFKKRKKYFLSFSPFSLLHLMFKCSSALHHDAVVGHLVPHADDSSRSCTPSW